MNEAIFINPGHKDDCLLIEVHESVRRFEVVFAPDSTRVQKVIVEINENWQEKYYSENNENIE